MDDIKKAVDTLKDLLRSKKGLDTESHISNLTLTIGLLELPSPSMDQNKTLSGFLRGHLQPLYSAHLQPTLNYAIAVLKFLHNEKIVPFLRNRDPGRANLWEGPASSVVSGILDYLEQHQTKKARETVASAVYPAICAFYFTNGQGMLSSYDGNILSNVYMLLGETVESPGGDVSKLRDHHIGSRRFGGTIAELRNYLALESIVNLLGNLIPPVKSGREKRTKFLQEVFEETKFKDCKRILQALEIIKRDWTVTATKIIELLADSDIRFPQPFQVIRFQVESSPMKTSDPLFVDNKSFVASLDQGGSVDSLVIPFATVSTITIFALNGSEMKVELLTNKAPLLGNNPMPLPQRGTYSVSFSIMKGSMNNFGKAMRERNLKMEHPAHRKLSQAPSELLPEFMTTEKDKKWQTKVVMLTNMVKHGDPDRVGQDKSAISSPLPGHSTSSNVDGHQDLSTFVGESSDNLPSTVFLDPNGNFSIHPPRPTTDLDDAHTETVQKNILSRKQIDAPDDEEIPSRPKRNPKSKIHTIIISDDDDDDERPASPGVEAPKQQPGKTRKKSNAAQVPKVLKKDDTPSRQTQKLATEKVDDDSRKPRAKTDNDAKESTAAKRRALHDDASDVEAPAAKRARQVMYSIPPSPITLPEQRAKYGRKSQHVSIASPATDNGGFDVDFDEIPKPMQDHPQTRAKAMKGKGGKVAPRPRPVTAKKSKKQFEAKEAVQRKTNVEVQDADKTLVEQTEQHEIKTNFGHSARDTNLQAVSKNKSVKPRSKKSNTAPWEAQDFASVKVEMSEEVTVNFDPTDDLPSKIEKSPSDIVISKGNHDLPQYHEGIFGDTYIDFREPLRAETTSSSELPPSPPVPAQSGQVWIDLTNSPEPDGTKKSTRLKRTVGKTPSFDRRRHESVDDPEVPPVHQDKKFLTTRIDGAYRTVEKLLLPPTPLEFVSSTPSRTRDERSTKTRKFSSPIRVHRLLLGGEKHKPSHRTTPATGRHLEEEEEETRSRAIPKEQKSGPSSSRRRVRELEVEDDPDLRIAAVLGEINKVLVGNIQNRFTGMSNELQRTKRELKAQVAGELGKINHELYKRYNNLVDLYEGYACHKIKLVDALEVFEKASADRAQNYRDILDDFRRNNLRNKLPQDIVKESTIAGIMKLTQLNIDI